MSDGKILTPAGTERARRRSAQRKRLILCVLAAFLLAGAIVGARYVYHRAKARRADQFATAGDEFAKAGKWNEAADKYRAALQLDPLGYHGLEGAARLATRLTRPEALDLWAEVIKLPQTTRVDRQEYAGLLVNLGKFKVAEPIIEGLLKSDPDTQTLNLASRYASGTGDNVKAIEFARIAVKRAPEDDMARFALADLLAESTDPALRAEARTILWEIAAKEGPYRQAAIEGLGRSPELSAEERNRVLQMLDSVKSPTIKPSLLSADLRLQLHPEDANRIYDQTVARWNGSENPELIELARWLNLRQQGERVLSLFSLDRALQDNQLLLARLDAMALLQRWDDIDNLLGHPDLTLDPSVVESFRARTAQERNATLDAELHWNHAISLAANDPYKLRFVANFAEQSHANAAALKAYDQLAKIPAHAALAYRGTQRLSARGNDVAVQRAAAEKIASLAPDDPNASNQLAYLNLLLGGDLDSNFETAKTQAEKFPDRLSFRVTAALGYLRKHDPGLALAQFKGPAIEWPKTPPAWRAVYAATLLANEQAGAAREIIATIPVDKLSPEERALIQPDQK
jgi:hypothetical protein